MAIVKNIETIIRIDNLIRLKATGTPKSLANKINMSERNIYKIISNMKEMGAPIKYCNISCSFIYTEKVELKVFSKN